MILKKMVRLLAAATAAVAWPAAAPSEVTFQRVADHCHFASLGEGKPNMGAVVTGEGVLLIDPPGEEDLPVVLEALRNVSSSPVRWIVCTSFRRLQSSRYAYFLGHGAVLVGSKALDGLAFPDNESPAGGGRPEGAQKTEGRQSAGTPRPQRFVFESRLRLFPDSVEVRIMAVRARAVTAGDVVVCVPDEKVLYTGDLFAPGAFPEIDTRGGGGDVLGWSEGMKQAMAAVPMLKPAMARTQPELPPVPPELEKSPEENVVVIPGRGPLSNLKQMKELLEAAQKLRAQAARAAALKRSLQNFLASGGLDEFRNLANFEAFAGLLLEALAGANK
jgi:glyoxylase-like metal-dependent hydrolase (beta-lactamase superfamily II)